MAIYQFYLAVIPKKGLLKLHKQIPKKLNINIKDDCIESEAEIYWDLERVAPNGITEKIDKIVSRANWGNNEFNFNWKTYTKRLDNDAWIAINEKTGTINEFSFRADLRELNLLFLMNMIELGKQYDWIFMDNKGMLSNPEIEEVKVQIRKSNAYRFLKDPKNFLEDMDSGK
ncbi:hypothetical protein WJR50_33815 [Catalinimonas sp. 4WD22]|uniref:hypothetical protein n=1 Tax=Catalinimonas locisalis TaxID=3133978 RepID=UPI003100AD77